MLAWIRMLSSRLRTTLRPGADDNDFERELHAHVDLMADDLVSRGATPEEAARAARIRLGGVVQARESHRERARLSFVDEFVQDARYAARTLARSRGFTAVAVLTLAIGIGATTAIFSVVYAVVLRPLPYPHAEQLFNVFQVQEAEHNTGTGWSYLNFADLRDRNRVFSGVAGTQHHQLTLTGFGDPIAVNTSVVTADFFTVFQGTPLAGRTFSTRDGDAGAPAVVVLSEALWRGPFGADPGIIGRAIDLDHRPFTVVGIMPQAFRFPLLSESRQLWIPLRQDPLFGPWVTRRGGHWLQVTGRLRPGVSLQQAQTDLDAIAARSSGEFPADNAGWTTRMLPLQRMIVFDVRSALLVLLAAVGVVLLIACANIANLLLTRATSRSREIAVRAALGASRGRIARQLLSETAVLGAIGGAAGLALAYGGVRLLSSLVPPDVPRVNDIAIDPVVLAFAIGLSALATLGFGLAPAMFASRVDLQKRLREDGRSGESAGRRRARSVLAAGEVALALVLLTAGGLVLRSFAKLTAVNPGFNPEHLLKAEVSLPRFQYSTPEQWRRFADDLLNKVQAEAGLRNTAVTIPPPITDGAINLSFEIVGTPAPSANAARTASYVSITPEYFRVMGIPLVSGRVFDGHDVPESAPVCVISAAMARLYFPDRDPIGQRLRFGFPPGTAAEREIIGVVGDVRDVRLEQDPGAMMYVPFAQAPFPGAVLVARTTLDPGAAVATIRRDVTAIDSNLPVTDVGMMPALLDASLAQPRFRTFLLGMFAVIALGLAAIGIFGVISYSVSCRTHEIGVRVALGASRSRILRMIVGETAIITAAGFALGIPVAMVAARFLGHLLFDVSTHDPLTLAGVACILGATAALAGYLPARRATRVLPTVALRHE
jgi:putative ABC transport system permease protein